MSKRDLEEMIQFHRKQAELNRGKAAKATERANFHERTVVALMSEGRAS